MTPFIIETNLPQQAPNIEAALKIIAPSAEVVAAGNGMKITVLIEEELYKVTVVAPELAPEEGRWERQDREILDPRYNSADRQQRLKELARLGIIEVVGRFYGKKPAWGILSGVRPTKIFHYLREKGFSVAAIEEKLRQIYGLSPEKANLVCAVGASQERFFKPAGYIGVYVGIPFCPTRCRYCSFAAVSLETHGHLVKNFLIALKTEIEAASSLCRELGLTVDSVYLGGGTPTSLGESDFAAVLGWIGRGFLERGFNEFTVEAGRPETITQSKILAMVKTGVTRISINPQTMHDRTLAAIGRKHSVDRIYRAVELLRRTSAALKLNMDLILGLPGEGEELFLDSLQKVIALQPDNITAHTLAPKRAADWRREFLKMDLAADSELVETGQKAAALLAANSYFPYYLYRQREILAGLENIGYARPGMESVYNIQMMEERQTIFGIGGGAVTKWVIGPNHRVFRHQNPKCPATYCHRVTEEIVKKGRQSRLLLC